MKPIVAVDVGGTFTDVVSVVDGMVSGWKVTTTEDQSDGVSEAVAGTDYRMFLHGTTAATNTLLQERGAEVSLVTDPGFEDLVEIGRQDRPSLYDSFIDRPTALVPRDRRHSDPTQVADDAEIVAVALLDSFKDDSAEQSVLAGLRHPAVLSSRVSPEFREYERTATTVLSAYVTPSIRDYLANLDSLLGIPFRLVMTSSGGLIPFPEATELAGRLLLSGPAGGVVAAAALGRHHGHHSVISFDMGGTSTDVSRITGGAASARPGYSVAGRTNRVPSIPIRTIGAGGGSIAWVDSGGALRVGTQSAGATPGPAVYGRGGRDLTVTDANVLLGNIPSSLVLGGRVSLDLEAGIDAAGRLSSELGLSVEETLRGVIEVVDAHMERALRSVSVEEGVDPRKSVLVAFGGAGALHASRLGRRLGVEKVLIPPHSGVFSALGLLMAQPRADAVATVMLPDGAESLDAELHHIEARARSRFQEMFSDTPAASSTEVDVRYFGQSHEIEVSGTGDWVELRRRFHEAHSERFGFDRQEPIEAVNVRATAVGPAPMSWADVPEVTSDSEPRREGSVWHRESLPAGFQVAGHAVIVEANSATLLDAGEMLTVLADGSMEISW